MSLRSREGRRAPNSRHQPRARAPGASTSAAARKWRRSPRFQARLPVPTAARSAARPASRAWRRSGPAARRLLRSPASLPPGPPGASAAERNACSTMSPAKWSDGTLTSGRRSAVAAAVRLSPTMMLRIAWLRRSASNPASRPMLYPCSSTFVPKDRSMVSLPEQPTREAKRRARRRRVDYGSSSMRESNAGPWTVSPCPAFLLRACITRILAGTRISTSV